MLRNDPTGTCAQPDSHGVVGTRPRPDASMFELSQFGLGPLGTAVTNGMDQDLWGVLTNEQTDDLKGVLGSAHGREPFAIFKAVHHH